VSIYRPETILLVQKMDSNKPPRWIHLDSVGEESSFGYSSTQHLGTLSWMTAPVLGQSWATCEAGWAIARLRRKEGRERLAGPV
jgi:hypothetical protein